MGLDPIVLEVNSLKRNDVPGALGLIQRIRAKLSKVPADTMSSILRLQDDPAELLRSMSADHAA